MISQLKVAVAGLTHDHVWTELEYWRALSDVQVVAVADRHEPLRTRASSEFAIQNQFHSWQTMLEEVRPDIIQICSSNRESAEIAVAAIRAGIHVVLEKPMAANLAQSLEIINAASEMPHVKVAVNWPDWSLPHFQIAPLMIEHGAIGTVIGGSSVMGHPGPEKIGCSPYFCDWLTNARENGGGAMMDYGCYGAAALSLLVGPVTEVWAFTSSYKHIEIEVEDTAQLVLRHANGLSQISAAWTRVPPVRELIIYGSEGTVWLNQQGGWIQTIESEKLPIPAPNDEDLPFQSAPELIVKCIKDDKPIPGIFSLAIASQAQSIIEAGYQSVQSRSWVPMFPTREFSK